MSAPNHSDKGGRLLERDQRATEYYGLWVAESVFRRTLSRSYDGFGNKVSQTVTKGSGPTMSVVADPASNRLVGFGYDANGNLTNLPGTGTFSYDIENREAVAYPSSGGMVQYGYGPDNKQVYAGGTILFSGVSGETLGYYQPTTSPNGTFTLVQASTNLYFAGKPIQKNGGTVVVDRLGSVRASAESTGVYRMSYFPYGEPEPGRWSTQEPVYATYAAARLGLNYANQRYYASTLGRFMTADPYRATVTSPSNPAEPQSWDRYAYVEGNPVNRYDPSGLLEADPDSLLDADAGGSGGYGWPIWDCGPGWITDASLRGPCTGACGPWVDWGWTGGGAAGGGGIVDPLEAGGWIFDSLSTGCTTGIYDGVFGVNCPYGLLLAPSPSTTTLSQLLRSLAGVLGNALGAVVMGLLNPQRVGGNEEICWEQYQADLDICRQLHDPSCYDQAAQRYANCLTGKPLPPFPFQPPIRRQPSPNRPIRPPRTRVL